MKIGQLIYLTAWFWTIFIPTIFLHISSVSDCVCGGGKEYCILYSFRPITKVRFEVFNLLKKYYRKNHYENDLLGMLSTLPEQEVPSTEHLIEVQEDMKHFLYVLSKLKKDEQELVLLRTYGELSFAEVGEMLGKSENYARVTFHRLKRKLQQEMEDM